MTIEKAKKILGKYAIGKTDEEIEAIIASESRLCDVLLPVFERYLTSLKQGLHNEGREI